MKQGNVGKLMHSKLVFFISSFHIVESIDANASDAVTRKCNCALCSGLTDGCHGFQWCVGAGARECPPFEPNDPAESVP